MQEGWGTLSKQRLGPGPVVAKIDKPLPLGERPREGRAATYGDGKPIGRNVTDKVEAVGGVGRGLELPHVRTYTHTHPHTHTHS